MKNKSFKAAAVLAALFSAIFALSVNCHAQTVSSLLKDEPVLTQLFVHPFGLSSALESYNQESMKCDLNDMDQNFHYLDLGEIGKVFSVKLPDSQLGGVPVNKAVLTLGKTFNSVMYESEPCDNYKDMCTYLGDYLKKFSKSSGDENYEGNQISVYMLSDKYGVGLLAMDDRKVSMAVLLDMKDLQGFMNLHPVLPEGLQPQ